MSRNKRFTDRAGYTRHCWECEHTDKWYFGFAECRRTGVRVGKYDSPDNECCHLPIECSYDDGRAVE